MQSPIRIILADDHQLFRQGLKVLLAQEPDVRVVAETNRAEDLPGLLAQVPCDQLLLDLQMERNTLPDIEMLAARVPVLVVTASELPSDSIAAVRKGARGVVFKGSAVETLMEAIRTLARGEVWLPPSLQTQMAVQLRKRTGNVLSPREEEVVECIALGLRNAEVARSLAISEETVKTHLNKIFRKLGVRDRVELALQASRSRITANGKRD